MLKKIFTPFRIGHLEIPNRLIVPAMVMNFCRVDGTATEKFIAYHEARATGGWGLIITEDYAVSSEGRGFPNIPGLWNDIQMESHSLLVRRVREAGGRIFAQIYHAGRQTSRHLIGCPPVAPSPVPCPLMQEIPREMTIEEIHQTVELFGDCALRAKKVGFDGVEIHGAHGYLIAQFMSLYSNKRTDEYGGQLLNRMRFPLEIISNIRAKVGKDFPLIFRISGEELVPGGRNIEETKAISLILQEAGIDAIHVSAGVYGSFYSIAPPAAVSPGWITNYARAVKEVVNIPVIAVGRINDPHLAEGVIAGGQADFVAMGRASLADPDLPIKAAKGLFADINRCIACLEGCIGRISLYQPAACLVNPALGKEKELRITPADSKKKVFIAGGGPAGMEAAFVAAVRGHEVHLFEKTDRLGGRLFTAAIPPGKGEIAGFIAWQKKQIQDSGVALHLKTELTEKTIAEQSPDAVIVATGSKPLSLPAAEKVRDKIFTAVDVLEGRALTGARVAVIGGGMIGGETANHLAHLGREVTILEMLPEIARDVSPAARDFLKKDLAAKNVIIRSSTRVKEVLPDGLLIEKNNKEEKIGPFDAIVLALGSESVDMLKTILKDKFPRLIIIGDAVKPRHALEAIAEGYLAGMEI